MPNFEPLNPKTENQLWVTLMRCTNLVEADAIAMRLRAADIPVFIPDEIGSQILVTGPSVRVQVSPSQYQAARDFLDDSI
jgi:hypothetical protein